MRLNSSLLVLDPRFRQVEFEIEQKVLELRGCAEAKANLAIGYLGNGTGILTLNAIGMGPLLQESSIVDDPCLNGTATP